jgi:hypothetical protein
MDRIEECASGDFGEEREGTQSLKSWHRFAPWGLPLGRLSRLSWPGVPELGIELCCTMPVCYPWLPSSGRPLSRGPGPRMASVSRSHPRCLPQRPSLCACH